MMEPLLKRSLDESISLWWNGIDVSTRRAFGFILALSVAAFGFEMTNLTLNRDDVGHIFIQHSAHQMGVGRFGHAWLYYYTQGAHILPFLQMLQGMPLMAIYGVLVARLWGLTRTSEITLAGGLLCVFPYLAQLYQYNTSMATYPLAHLLAAAAVVLSVRATLFSCIVAAALYAAAFSIYQAVAANAATIFAFWFLSQLLFHLGDSPNFGATLGKATVTALLSVLAGGLLYLGAFSLLHIRISDYQAADQAFSLKRDFDLPVIALLLFNGSRSFFLWPENYFPGGLKKLQLVLVGGAALVCLLVPRTWAMRAAALAALALATLAPRALQLVHAAGSFHNLTLTAYAIVVAGSLMVLQRAGPIVIKNVSAVVASLVIFGYLVECNQISMVNYLNTVAHFSQTTQILARLRSLPSPQWDGATVVIAGSLPLYHDYPFLRGTGISNDFVAATHIQHLTRLLRDNVKVLPIEKADQQVRNLADSLPAWPNPASVATLNGIAVVNLGKGGSEGPPH
jgi:hypothetical protein